MSGPVVVPDHIYQLRAGLNPRPPGYVDDWTDSHFSPDEALAFYKATGRIFWADISEFQRVVSSAYPWETLAIRLDTGYRLDNHAKQNHSEWVKLKRGVLIGYAVFIPGESKAILGRLTNNFGKQLEGIAPMVDMESGSGFAGKGNHSSEANDFVGELANATGSIEREIGYANSGDWAGNWSNHGQLKHRILADYSSQIVSGWWAQQYYGGLNYPSPAGWPRGVAPFGSWVDLNSAAMSNAELHDSLGFGSSDDILEQIMAWYGSKAEFRSDILSLVREGQSMPEFNVGSDGKRHVLETFLAGVPGYKSIKARAGARDEEGENA